MRQILLLGWQLAGFRLYRRRGAAYVELALVLGLLVFLFLFCFECARNLRILTQLTSANREFVISAFRECADFASTPFQGASPTQINTIITNTNTCLQAQVNNMINTLAPGSSLRLTAVRWDETRNWSSIPPPPRIFAPAQGFQSPATGVPATKLQLSDFSTQGSNRAVLLQSASYLIYSELYSPYTPIIATIGSMFRFFDANEGFYVVAAT